jgi:hypothetical protein
MKPETVEGNRPIMTVPLLGDLHKSLMYFDINQIEKINKRVNICAKYLFYTP